MEATTSTPWASASSAKAGNYTNTAAPESSTANPKPKQMKTKEYNPERKWLIEVNEAQLYDVINCVEDCHRFAAGQMDLNYTTSFINDADKLWQMREALGRLQPLMTPELQIGASYGWNGSTCPDKWQKSFIARTYAIYRNLLHCIEKYRQHDVWNVYQSETLTCDFPLAVCFPKPEE